MKPNRGGRGRLIRARGGRGRGRNNWNNYNVRPQNARNWNQYNRMPPFPQYFSPRNRFPPPFFNGPPPPLPLPLRPPSPLPGTEEYRQRNIQETSELIKRHLMNVDGTTGDETFSLNVNTDAACTNEDQEEERSESIANTATPSTKKNKPARRQKSPTGEDCDVEEIHNKIIKHISKLSYSKKKHFVNEGLTGYDVAVQQLQMQKRLELSRALRDMSNRTTQDSADCEVINSIIPDIGIKIEDLPREVIARLSSTLGIELDHDGDWYNNQSCMKRQDSGFVPECNNERLYVRNESVNNPGEELESKNATSILLSRSPPRTNEMSLERQDSGLFKGRRFSNSFSEEDDILDDILNTTRSSSASNDSFGGDTERTNVTHPEISETFISNCMKPLENDKRKHTSTIDQLTNENSVSGLSQLPDDTSISTLNECSNNESVKLDLNQTSQKPSFPLIKLRPTKDLLKYTDDKSLSSEVHKPQNLQSPVLSEAQILKPLDGGSNDPQIRDVFRNDVPQIQQSYSREIHNLQKQQPSGDINLPSEEIQPETNIARLKVRLDLQAPGHTIKSAVPQFKLDRTILDQKMTKTEKLRLKRQRASARRAAQPKSPVRKISRKYKKKLRALKSAGLLNEEGIMTEDLPTKKHWRSAGEKKQLPNNLPIIDDSIIMERSENNGHSHSSAVIPFATFSENEIPKVFLSASSQTSIQTNQGVGIVPNSTKDVSCQCVDIKIEVTSSETQTETGSNEVREVREKRKSMLSQIAEIEQQICELMNLRRSLYNQLMDNDEINEMDQTRKRKCDSSLPSVSSSSKRSCHDENSQTKSHSSSTQEKSTACNAATSSTEPKVSRKSTKHKETSANHCNESNKSVTDKPSSNSSHHSSRSRTKEKTKKDESRKSKDKSSKSVSTKKAGDKSQNSSNEVHPEEINLLTEIKQDDEKLYDLSDIPLTTENVDKQFTNTNNNSNIDCVPPASEKGESDSHGSKEEKDATLEFKDWTGSILVIKVQGSKVFSGNDEGTLYFHDLKTATLLHNIQLGKGAITSICFPNLKDSHKFYVGTFEGNLYSINSRRQKGMLTFNLDENPVQCMEPNWGMLFIGATNGNIVRFSVKKNKIEDTISISQDSILTIRAVQEGARRVLLVATRNSPVTVRDAMTGLLMRTMESTSTPTVYTLLFHDNKVYCGTSQQDILIYTFQNGEFCSKYDQGRSSGVVCMKIVRNVLFAGCYNGSIYAYNLKTNKFIASMVGPAGLFLSMSATDEKIILATKMNHFKALSIPRCIRREMT